MKHKVFLGALVGALLFLAQCKKSTTDASTDFFPSRQVSTNINLLLAQYNDLIQLQGYVYLQGEGYKGIIVYHTADDRFVAFDRACPVNTTSSACAFVSVDSSSTFFRCGQYNNGFKPCCSSRFDPASGAPIQGEAKRPLKQYYTARQDNIVYISSTPF